MGEDPTLLKCNRVKSCIRLRHRSRTHQRCCRKEQDGYKQKLEGRGASGTVG